MKKARQVGIKDINAITQTIHHEKQESIRLNKFISSSGYCSRREADTFIENGCVYVDGKIASMGLKVTNNQKVMVNGHEIKTNTTHVYLIINKPVGIVCTTDVTKENNIIDYIDFPERVFPIGRLDKDSSGLLILTNDGDVVNKILRSHNQHEKEYIVTVDKPVTQDFLEKMQNGVKIYNPVSNTYQITKSCQVYKEDIRNIRILLSEGLNRQIRRMCVANGYHVTALKRIRIMNVLMDGLEVGEWRLLTDEEIFTLNKQLKKS